MRRRERKPRRQKEIDRPSERKIGKDRETGRGRDG